MKLEELSRLLRVQDPSAVLAPEPVLARVVQNVLGLSWATWRVPHTHCFLVNRGTLFKYVEQEELVLPPDHLLPDTVLLLEQPTDAQLARRNEPELLTRYWRLLFHVTLHRELERRFAGLTPAALQDRVERLGPAAFEEARNVLVHDGLLPTKADDRAAYVEFAAYYLELRFFAPNLIPVCFPSLPHADEVDTVLARDVDAVTLFRQTQLEGAADPAPKTDDQSDESHDFYRALSRQADRAAKGGDTVGAAILHTKAARVAPAILSIRAQGEARQDIYNLIGRLQEALGLTETEVAAWRKVLPTLLDKADQGARPVEAALLYDLQRACMDHEQTIYTLDAVEWASSGGKKPIKRELKSQEYVRIPAQLRSAIHRLAAARLTDADRQALGFLLRDALDRAESRLRDQFRPVLTEALRDAGLEPSTLPERAALKKTVEELLDRISSVGYLGFSDVRDAIARGQMKLHDLDGVHDILGGDQLLRLDRRLATLLDGVYRRAESYTRALERTTAVTAGTETGRWVTGNVALPFGGAFLAAEFGWLLVTEKRLDEANKVQREAAGAEARREAEAAGLGTDAARMAEERAVKMVPPVSEAEKWTALTGGWNEQWWFHLGWILLGVFFLSVVRSAAVRAALGTAGQVTYRAARFVFWDIPVRVCSNRWVRELIATVPAQVAINYVGKPLVVSAVLWAMFTELRQGPVPRFITFVAAAFLVNSRLGRTLEAILYEAARGLLHLIRSTPAVLRWIGDVFRELLDALDWVLARAEDWLRIRGRAGPLSVAVRVVGGLIWMPFAFLIRFYTVVFIEPMVNPLKLPLTLVFAKFAYPLLAVLGWFTFKWATGPDGWPEFTVHAVGVEPLSHVIPGWAAFLIIVGTFWLLPDALTYLFWEMRENWRLYRANRPRALRPVMVGSHGENVGALLHWGFHSGTVPKLFSRLRWAERQAAVTDPPNWRDARTHRAALRGVEESVRAFVNRELIEILNDPAAGWPGPRLAVGQVVLGTNRIRLELVPEVGRSAWLEWEDRSGWLVVGWAEVGFLEGLTTDAGRVLENALAYLYKRAGVDLVREQLRAELPAGAVHFDVASRGLLVWYGARDMAPVVYELGDPGRDLHPRNPEDLRPAAGPVLDAARIVFSRIVLTWDQWTAVWEAPVPGKPRPWLGPVEFPLVLLPVQPAPTPALPSAPPPPLALPPAPTEGAAASPVPEPSANGHGEPAAVAERNGHADAAGPGTDRNGQLHPEPGANGAADAGVAPPAVPGGEAEADQGRSA